MTSPLEELGGADALADAASRRSMRSYMKLCRIDCLPSPQPFGRVVEPWQEQEIIGPALNAFEWLARGGTYDGPLGFWNTYPRGHDKSSLIARFCNYLLVYGKRELPIVISVAAADQGQAKKIRNCMEREARLNPWFGKYLEKPYGEINKYDAKGPGGELVILTSDAGSAYGGGSDVIVCDEVTHWRNETLWTAMISESIKRSGKDELGEAKSRCVMFIITNAGYKGSWQHKAMEQFRADPRWYVNDKPGFRAGWMDKKTLRSVRDNIIASTGSPSEAMRLIDNIWVASRQGSVFSADDVEAVFRPDGPLWIDLAA